MYDLATTTLTAKQQFTWIMCLIFCGFIVLMFFIAAITWDSADSRRKKNRND